MMLKVSQYHLNHLNNNILSRYLSNATNHYFFGISGITITLMTKFTCQTLPDDFAMDLFETWVTWDCSKKTVWIKTQDPNQWILSAPCSAETPGLPEIFQKTSILRFETVGVGANTFSGWWLSPTPLKNMSSSMGRMTSHIWNGK